MTVLITGGAGYIGSVVAETFLDRGHDVIVYDNLDHGHRDAVTAPARLVVGELADTATLTDVLRQNQVEAVVHMAAHSIVSESMRDPASYFRNNVGAGLSLLDAMRTAGTERLVFSSTAAVYGEPDRLPIDEDAPLNPSNAYGQTKVAFEQALPWYERAYGLRWISLRYFNAAGASRRNGERHDPETHLIPLVLQAAAGTRDKVTVYGADYPTADGTCVRDYIHVRDLADAHLRAAEALANQRAGGIYNLGCGGDGYSVRQVIRSAEEVTGRTVPFVVGPRRAGDPACLVASSARIRQALGWSPKRQDLRLILEDAWRLLRR